MGITSEEPGKSPGKEKQDWNYEAPGRGETRSGYLAAAPLWITVHHEHGSRPCRQVVSRGALSCLMCACEAKSKQKGFVPYYSRDYLTLFVIVPDTLRLALSEIEPGTQIEIVRGKRVYDPAIPREKTFRPVPLPKSLPVGDQVDMLPSLLRMWKDAPLSKWHESTGSDKPLSLAAPPRVEVPAEILKRMHPVPAVNATDEAAALANVMESLHVKGKRLKDLKPSQNGKDHPPAGG